MAIGPVNRSPIAPTTPKPSRVEVNVDNKGLTNTGVTVNLPNKPTMPKPTAQDVKDTFTQGAKDTLTSALKGLIPTLSTGVQGSSGNPDFKATGGAGATGQAGASVGPDGAQAGASGSAGAGVGGVKVEGELPGGIQGEAHVNGPSISVEGHADAKVGKDGLDINLGVEVDATLADAGASAKKTIDFEVAGEKFSAEVDLSAAGKIGADGKINLNVHLGLDGKPSITASAEGFAGAKAELTGSVALKHDGDTMVSGSVTASATAGIGGKAHADIGISGGKVKFDVGAEATVGAGLGVEVAGEVNIPEIAEAVADVGIGAVGGKIEEGWNKFKDGIGGLFS
ncbi:transporter [Archangium primigenium]|uniref:transporter n=1 Tax=[Archangium] primigenium TaxID=2792470 RepID=UPI00195A7DBD|nr:transporter [Archangium primigenium]MBM7114373.1 transporter [Archangium primigenium]